MAQSIDERAESTGPKARVVDGQLWLIPPAAVPTAAVDVPTGERSIPPLEELHLFDPSPYDAVPRWLLTPDPPPGAVLLEGAAVTTITPALTDTARAPARRARLRSLDVARGLVIAGMVFVENLPGRLDQFPWWRHAAWNGWTGTDLVFPGFLVIMGVGLAFWLAPPVKGMTVLRLVRRSVALIVIGFLFNAWAGDGADLSTLRIPGVLQRIGLAGLLAGVLVLVLRKWWAIALLVLALLIGYNFALTHPHLACGPTTTVNPACNVAGQVDQAVFGPAHIYKGGTVGYDPEGLLSTMGAVASVLIGWVAGEVLRTRERSIRTAAIVGGMALGCLVASGVLFQNTPINKRIWTPPFTLFTAWTALMLVALLYLVLDVPRRPAWAVTGGKVVTWPWAVLGRNALVIYIGQHVVGTALGRTVVAGSTPGATRTASQWFIDTFLTSHVGEPGVFVVYGLCVVVAWWLVAWLLHLARWYITL